MRDKLCFLEQKASVIGRKAFWVITLVTLMLLGVRPSMATMNLEWCGKPIRVNGYINQGVSFGIAGDEFDTKQNFQSALFQLLLEAKLTASPNLQFFSSIGCNADWAYPILSGNDEWEDKGFDSAYDELFIYSHGRDILHELHVTWTPGNWFFRLGKQIVSWGETDGFRLMDQINPLDARRGMTDVEFETTILPIWMVKAEYFLPLDSSWLQDLGLEFIFNPNPDFRGDEVALGNDKAGIWAPKLGVRLGFPYPFDLVHVGSPSMLLDKPDSFEDDGFEYGFRIKSVIRNTIVTLNGFYGRENLYVARLRLSLPRIEVSPDDGRVILHLPMEGYHPLIRFVGFTVSRDFEDLYITALGGVAPVLRVEAFYAFENTFLSTPTTFDKFDEVRYAIGIDWKVWMRFLNERAGFMISSQFYHRKIMDYPSGGLQGVRDDNYQATLMINTTYFHNKIMPLLFWMRDISQKANVFKIQVSYERSHEWNYTLGVFLANGAKTGQGFEPYTNKDQVYFTVAYRF